MAQSLVLKIKGLYTSLNELSEVPAGALLTADNIDIVKDSIAEPRRGFERLTGGYSDTTHRTARTWFYQDKQFAHHGTSGSENTVSYFNSGSWTSVGTYSAPSGSRIRDFQANQNLYILTSAGVVKLDAYNGTPAAAGAFKGLDIQASLSGSSGFLTDTYYAVYRVLWGIKDANGNLVIGAPSQRELIQNTAGGAATRDVSLTFTIPSGATTAWFYQIYRSKQGSTEPDDELGLVYEGNPSSGDISAGTVTVVDIVPDSLRGTTIYTASSQQGLANQNERPPLAKDVAIFRDCAFYAYTTSRHRYFLTLLSVGGTNGIAANDTIAVGGVTYTAKTSETIASRQFKVTTSGTAATNVRDTALSLVRVINRAATSTVYAYYLSGPDDTPGMMLLEERSIGGNSFAVVSSRATCWNPDLPTSGTTESSTNDVYPNGLMWSKPGQPEAVPVANFKAVGSKDSAILRVVALQDALYIFKTEGIYRLTGDFPSFDIELFDSSARLIAPESPAVLNNQIYCFTDQGVTVVADAVKVISRPIEQDLNELMASAADEVEDMSFGISYETERKYYLFMVTSSTDDYPQQAWVYNVFTNAWTRHLLNATCGVDYGRRLYLGNATSNYIVKDRKNRSYLDYADFGFSTSISTIASLTLTLASGVDEIAAGDIVYQSATKFALVTAVDPITSQVTVQGDPGFTAAACDILKAISTVIEWAPSSLGNPAVQKQFHTAIALFKTDFLGTGYLGFKSDLSQFEEQVSISGLGIRSWGLSNWGETPWGDVALKRPIRQLVPRDKQRASQLTLTFRHAVGYSPWQLQGISLLGEMGTEQIGR